MTFLMHVKKLSLDIVIQGLSELSSIKVMCGNRVGLISFHLLYLSFSIFFLFFSNPPTGLKARHHLGKKICLFLKLLTHAV